MAALPLLIARLLPRLLPRLLTLVGAGSVLLASVAVVIACSKDDPAAPRLSQRGELCAVTGDCAEGLACAPMPGDGTGGSGGRVGICVTGAFHVAPTAKRCTIVECTSTVDCCDDSLAAGCELDRVNCAAGNPSACQSYQQKCGCMSGAIQCTAGRCLSHCNTDIECAQRGAGARCAGGNCVQCALDMDCTPGKTCVTGRCQAACTGDGDCGGFDRCLGGHCIASGCQADRECVASTRNVDARCGTDGKCIVPCMNDLECGNPTSYNFFSCIDKQCTYVGCESDKDCRLFYSGASDASVLQSNQHAVCKDNAGLGAVVKSAQ